MPTSLPIVMFQPNASGGLEVSPAPRAQGSRFRIIPRDEMLGDGALNPCVALAEGAAARAIQVLEVTRGEFADGIEICFVEPLDAPSDDGPVAGFAGFFSDATPGRIWIVVAPWTPLAAVEWVVAHEIAHAVYWQRLGDDGSGPVRLTDCGPRYASFGASERFADAFADRLYGRPRALLGKYGADPLPLRPVAHMPALELSGAITVINPGGTTIIDGTSDMFRIAATGTLNITGCNGTGGMCNVSNNVTLATGLTVVPAHLSYLQDGGIARTLPRITRTGSDLVDSILAYTEVVGGTSTRLTIFWDTTVDRSALTLTARYYVLQQIAF